MLNFQSIAPATWWMKADSVCMCVFDPVSERLLKVSLISRGVFIISVYAPAEVDEDTKARRFYDELQALVINANKKDMLIILGYFNTRVGPSETHLHRRYNSDKRNENGIRLVDFCHRKGLLLTNTLFPHKKIHQCTSWNKRRTGSRLYSHKPEVPCSNM